MAGLLFDRPAPASADLVFGAEVPVPVQRPGDLLFEQAQTSNTNLVFGAGPPPASVDFALTGTLPGLTFTAAVGPVVGVVLTGALPTLQFVAEVIPSSNLHLIGTLPAMTVAMAVEYFSNAARPTVGQVQGPWQIAAHASQNVEQAHQDSPPSPAAWIARWQDAARSPAGVEHLLPSGFDRTNRPDITGPFQDASGLHDSAQFAHQDATRTRLGLIALFKDGTGARDDTLFKHQDGTRTHARRETSQQQATPRPLVRSPDRHQVASALLRAWQTAFQDGVPPPPGLSVLPVFVPPPPPPCYLRSTALLFEALAAVDGSLVFRCDAGLGPVDPEPPGATRVVPIRAVYIVTNNITLHRVDTGAELHAHSFSMSLDYQSWTWSWQASLHADAAAHLGRDAQGDPAELQVQVNGTPFRLRLVSVSRDRRFSPTRWSVSGQGKAAVLAGPWAPKLSFGNPTADRTAQQLAADALTINGVPIGWAIEWGLTDWAVPAGAWALQGTYIDAINDIAASVGGYVQPHPTAATLRILPRYPAVPWAWGSITPDFEIPEDAAEVEGTQYVDRPAYNRVFVGGVGAGVFGPFTRAGTAGNSVAPQATHALITDAPAHRQRGIAVLSDTGRQEHITLNMQVLPETGVIVPGQFVRYLSPTPKLGIVRSTSIDWSRPKLRQTIRVETHV